MSEPAPTAASSALVELLEVSPQVDAAVILERDGGRLLASAPATSDRMADRLGATCVRILEAAEQARTELGREPVAQVEVATPDGHVFVVADTSWIVAAVTDADPTVGLVFYDLKTALRAVRETQPAASSSNGAAPIKLVVDAPKESSSTADGDEESASSDAESTEGAVDANATAAGDDGDGASSDGATSDGDTDENSDAGTTRPTSRWRKGKS